MSNYDENNELPVSAEMIERTDDSDVCDKTEEEKGNSEFYALPQSLKARKRMWSLVSLVSAILSCALCPIYYVSLVLVAVAIGGAMKSRRSLGFFDKMSIGALILGIFGGVFGLSSLIVQVSGLADKLF